jgi:hypothetical protein
LGTWRLGNATHERRNESQWALDLDARLVAACRPGDRGSAQSAGVIATLDGTVEIGRAGAWAPAVIGSTVEVGDTIRTGKPGRVRLSFRDDSVVNVGDDSQLVIDESVFDPDAGEARSVLDLLNGKVRAIVSEHYKEPSASYEIRTVTAVSGVRGTDFIMVHDPATQRTQVVGVSGLVDVNGSVARDRFGVVVGAQEITEVESGGYPSPPRRLDQTTFRQYLDGLEFIGFGIPESLLFDNPIARGDYIPPADRVEGQLAVEAGGGEIPVGSGAAGAIPPWEQPDVSDSIGQPPGAVEGGEVGIEF